MEAGQNAGNHRDNHQQQLARFDYLMKRYLAREASDSEKDELSQLTESGFAYRFKEWLDKDNFSGSEDTDLSDKTRRQILTNILGSSPDAKQRGIAAWWSWAAVAVLALGVSLWFSLKDSNITQNTLSSSATVTQDDERQVVRGRQFLTLPDGSKVVTNDNTELSFSVASFSEGFRDVTLKGEAYFDIAHNPAKPFRVKTGTVVTKVLGTAFNVNANQNKVVVIVTRGLVEVGAKDRVLAKVRPDERFTVDTHTYQFSTASVSASQEVAWKDTYLIFDNIDLKKAGELISEHYGVQIVFTKEDIEQCRITASFLHQENLDTVLTVLSKMIGASYQIKEKRIFIEGGSCN